MTDTTRAARTDTRTTRSADGTPIAYEVTGTGPAVVLVDGALCFRGMGPSRELADQLASRFTVLAYDRRGRGDSGPGSAPWSVEREVEDLRAVIDAAGGRAHLVGASSGAALALEAVRRGAPVDRVVGYEAPFVLDASHEATDADFGEQLQRLVDEGRRGDAVAAFMEVVGVPPLIRFVMRRLPVWRKLTAVAHTLPYDMALTVPFRTGRPLPSGYYAAVTVPVAMVAGGKSPAYMRNAQAAIAAALPDGTSEEVPGQTHMVKAKALAPVFARHLVG
jgi:pimeloyl-ACP methyl ester carboxylesterase